MTRRFLFAMILITVAPVWAQTVVKGNVKIKGNTAVGSTQQLPSGFNARTDNCVTGVESDCTGSATGHTGSPMSFRYRTTDTIPFPDQNCTTGSESACANNAFTDPDFGSYMVLVTDTLTSNSVSSFNMGSNGEWDAFNEDSTLFLASKNGGAAFLYQVNPAAIHAKTCSPATPCIVKSQITTGTVCSPTPCTDTKLAQNGDWSFSRKPGETNVLYEEDSAGTINKLTINTSGSPSGWTLTRAVYVNFTSDSPVACSVLPAGYVVGWSGVFATANDGSVTKAYGGGVPWPGAGQVISSTETFIYPNVSPNNASTKGFQATTIGTTGISEPNWHANCNTDGQTCTDGSVVWTNIGNLKSQGNGYDIVQYKVGVGCSHLNMRTGRVNRGTGVALPSGLITSMDDTVCARLGTSAPCAITDRFTLHESSGPFDSSFVSIGPNGSGGDTCITPGTCSCAASNVNDQGTWSGATTYHAQDLVFFNTVIYVSNTTNTNSQPDTHPTDWTRGDVSCFTYVWQVASLVVNPCIEIGALAGVGSCSGHSYKGYQNIFKGGGLKSHLWSRPSIAGQANPGFSVLPNGFGNADHHGSARDENTTDSLPLMGFTAEVPTFTADYTVRGYAEDVAFSTDVLHTVWRFNHNWNTGSSAEFAIQNAIGVMSQDGRFAALGSDFMGTRGSKDSGGSPCNKLRADYGPAKNQVVNTGDKVLPTGNNTGQDIYQAQAPGGTEGSSLPNWNTSCPNLNDTCTDGTVTWKNLGPNNCRGDIMIVDLLSAHPLP